MYILSSQSQLVDYKISRLLVITLERRFRSWVLALKTMIVQPSEAPKEAVICFLLLDKVLQQILKLPSTEIGTFHKQILGVLSFSFTKKLKFP